MLDDLELVTGNRAASDVGEMGGLIVGAVLGMIVWTLIALIISAVF